VLRWRRGHRVGEIQRGRKRTQRQGFAGPATGDQRLCHGNDAALALHHRRDQLATKVERLDAQHSSAAPTDICPRQRSSFRFQDARYAVRPARAREGVPLAPKRIERPKTTTW